MYSRREVLTNLRRALLALPVVILGPRLAGAQQTKIDQKTAQYQDSPKNGQKCSACVHFEPPKGCKLVLGDISPNGWCMLYSPKS